MIRKLSKILDARDKIQANKRRHIRNAPFSPLLKNKKERGTNAPFFRGQKCESSVERKRTENEQKIYL